MLTITNVWSCCGMPQSICQDVATELKLIPLPDISMNNDPRMTQGIGQNSGSSIRQRAPTPVSLRSSQDSSSQLGVGGLPPVEASSHRGFDMRHARQHGIGANPFGMTWESLAAPHARQQHHHPYRLPAAPENRSTSEDSHSMQQELTDHVHENWSTITNPKQDMRIRARRRMKNSLKEARNHHACIQPESQRTRKAHAEGRARGPRGTFLPRWESPMPADQSV